jgi:mycothiol system anti-sigma-R factor
MSNDRNVEPQASGAASPEYPGHQEDQVRPDLPLPGGESGECRQALERLYTYLDGELTDQRLGEIRHHLEECSSCLEVFDFEAELKLVVARHCRDHAPEELRIRVAIALAEASSTSGDDAASV